MTYMYIYLPVYEYIILVYGYVFDRLIGLGEDAKYNIILYALIFCSNSDSDSDSELETKPSGERATRGTTNLPYRGGVRFLMKCRRIGLKI